MKRGISTSMSKRFAWKAGPKKSHRTPAKGSISNDRELPPLPEGDMVLDDSRGERDYSMSNDEILERIRRL
jgi:hypothetical protein